MMSRIVSSGCCATRGGGPGAATATAVATRAPAGGRRGSPCPYRPRADCPAAMGAGRMEAGVLGGGPAWLGFCLKWQKSTQEKKCTNSNWDNFEHDFSDLGFRVSLGQPATAVSDCVESAQTTAQTKMLIFHNQIERG